MYALFGHSMGAWIAWEMLQELTRRGLPLPARMFASGNRWEGGLKIPHCQLLRLPLHMCYAPGHSTASTSRWHSGSSFSHPLPAYLPQGAQPTRLTA